MASLIAFQDFLTEIRPAVNRRILEVMTADESFDDELLPLLQSGKRMRAGLLICVHQNLTRDREIPAKTLDLACAVELAHASSLILDDMLDEDTVRRGRRTLHLTRGQKQAMLDTIGILSLPYALAAPYGPEYVTMLSSTQRSMVLGVMKEMFMRPELPATSLYDAIITRKTGHLFSLTAAWGSMAAGRNGSTVGAFADYGLRVGKVMQIADDIADLEAIVAGRKRTGFGSEMLLLRCVCADRLCGELVRDLMQKSLNISKARDLWSAEGIERTLTAMLNRDIARSADSLAGNAVLPAQRSAFIRIAREIAAMMLAEGIPAKAV